MAHAYNATFAKYGIPKELHKYVIKAQIFKHIFDGKFTPLIYFIGSDECMQWIELVRYVKEDMEKDELDAKEQLEEIMRNLDK